MTRSRVVSRRTALKVGAGAAALALPSVARGERAAVLKLIPLADLVSLDPIWTTATVTRSHGFMVFDTLYGQAGADQGFVATPQMVAGHTVESEGKIWKLTLRDGLFFHDGTKVLARDCVASIRRWGVRDGFGQVLMQRTDELSAADDRTIVFRLKKPFGLLPDALGKFASNMCAIMPERLASTDPFTQITDATGSGPFKFMADERVQGSLFAYERFKNYRPRNGSEVNFASGPKIAHFDRVEWHVIPDPATAAAALQSGEMDWWELTIPDLLPPLRRGGKVTIQRYGSLGVCSLLRPNHLFSPFNNAAVRRALIGAIDQTELMTAMMGSDPSLRRVPAGFFAPVHPWRATWGSRR